MQMMILKPEVEKSSILAARSGLQVLELKRGLVKCLMPLEGNADDSGVLPSSALYTLTEVPGKALYLSSFNTERFTCSLKHVDMKFMQPARSDVTLEIRIKETILSMVTAEAEINGRSEYLLEGSLKDEDGNVVAKYKGTYEIRPVKQ